MKELKAWIIMTYIGIHLRYMYLSFYKNRLSKSKNAKIWSRGFKYMKNHLSKSEHWQLNQLVFTIEALEKSVKYVFIVNPEHISHLFLVFLLLTLKK